MPPSIPPPTPTRAATKGARPGATAAATSAPFAYVVSPGGGGNPEFAAESARASFKLLASAPTGASALKPAAPRTSPFGSARAGYKRGTPPPQPVLARPAIRTTSAQTRRASRVGRAMLFAEARRIFVRGRTRLELRVFGMEADSALDEDRFLFFV